MELAEAVAAQTLWGWPVDVLDKLLLVQQNAWAGNVSIVDWRAADTELRAGHPEVDPAEVGEALSGWVNSGELSLQEHGTLLGRVTVLANGAPADDDLWEQLAGVLARSRQDKSANLAAADHEQRDRIAGWLRAGDGIDGVTGLPWSVLANHRAESTTVDEARKTALAAVSESERERADLVATQRDSLDTTTGDAWPE